MSDSLTHAFNRNRRALSLRPAMGRKTAISHARVVDGSVCEVSENGWSVTADVGTKSGGTGRAPDPGVLMRAAIGSCLAISIRLWAGVHDVAIDEISVTVETELDAGAQYGLGDQRSGFLRLRTDIDVVSDAPRYLIERVIADADRACVNLDAVAGATPIERSLSICPSSTLNPEPNK